ncbi:MAG: methylated-DNA--[protein]-cysteine S-methyltransferase [Coriobacteriia bacterium]|nr:methylated-DNA--[protein]-cysteine S-methyltransferase [Coriobacteriia bacterium]MCL2745750.1 methylated-DNA--[protein]-cysteine S-methyltransferase [Coriobacteriia bacterium]MCL2870537.1 methylated-DNA--[protein]-cysteine S-methyltransferase [Coriobacteriia bacterium]
MTYHTTPVGELALVEEGGSLIILGLVGDEMPGDVAECTPGQEPEVLACTKQQLDEYFAGERRDFDLPLAPQGTDFQVAVWDALYAIPWGETRNYGQIAAQVGKPKAARAVGGANNRNPIAIVIPCHRVIGANGAMVGYRGGVDIKEHLLKLEGII